MYKNKESGEYQKDALRIKGLNSFILSIEKQGYDNCFSENMKNIIKDLSFENFSDFINNL